MTATDDAAEGWDIAVVGAGAAGSVAALRAREAGASVLLLERDALPRGSTALSAGLVPAAGTRAQRAAGIVDDPARFAADILRKAHGEPDPAAVNTVVAAARDAIDWLEARHGFPFTVLDGFLYPGHSAHRMHGLPNRSGAELMDRLTRTVEGAGIDLLASARVTGLVPAPGGGVAGLVLERPDETRETVGCHAVVLACNGYGGAPDLVARFIPDMAGATYFGHPGNTGDALAWAEPLRGLTRHLSGYQGHGSVAQPHGILITWATITEGGWQVDARGERFHDESRGYSEAAAAVLARPDGIAWTIFDERIAGIAREFEDFRAAESAGAILAAPTLGALAVRLGIPDGTLEGARPATGRDRFGRDWTGVPALAPPFRAVRVTGALFHTQGGLVVDQDARVLTASGPIRNLFAAGGAAAGVSGDRASGYLSGNGLLTAVGYGYLAGAAAAQLRIAP